MKRYRVISLILLGAMGAAIFSRMSFDKDNEYGTYVPVRCMEYTPRGESCIQTEITAEERKMLDHGRVWASDGYSKVVSSYGMMNVVNTAIEVAKKRKSGIRDQAKFDEAMIEARKCMPKNFQVLGLIPPRSGRWEAIYRNQLGRDILLARSDFYASGGRVGAFAHMMRVAVNGNPATVVLLVPKWGSARLWEVVWDVDGINFELSVEDESPNNQQETTYSIHDVLNIASEIDRHCHWPREKLPQPDLFDRPPGQ